MRFARYKLQVFEKEGEDGFPFYGNDIRSNEIAALSSKAPLDY